ncbi:MAG: phosphoadenosine phosphosulfate reductase family protein [Spirochaetaceae bacterium]|jgi:3'-phosphoadenosine 5'-phosphosulfate sulfotransferase (PAPS reductase)/FAD synthetase/ferredoxin|nr:phosphoadenosine phosphosulfate reductase family protein [Spirochaetaceae bacterium]
MYSYIWDKKTRGYLLTTQTGKFVANEIRPVFAQELSLTGLGRHFEYDRRETRPLMWAQKNIYIVADINEKSEPYGRKVAQLNKTQYGKPLNIQVFFEGKLRLAPVNIKAMVAANAGIMDIIVADAKRRTKELYDGGIERRDIAYIAFSGGKDSVALLDICHRVLPLSVPVIFSDTDMELPDTYKVWEEIQNRYPEREFIRAKAESSALENWRVFGPPSRAIRWCCSVHKSTPALMTLKRKLRKSAIKVMAFVGVRGDESHSRSFYEDATDGAKNASQLNLMPILDWGAHELWLYIFANDLLVNCAYKKGLNRVGCLMCPESSERHLCLVNTMYPAEIKHYSDIIVRTSSKVFKNATDKAEFIGDGWQARKSGVILQETLAKPLEEDNELKTTFQSPHFQKDLFYEWIKTLGTVVREHGSEQRRLKLPNTLDYGIPFSFNAPYTGGGTVTFEFRSQSEQTALLPILMPFLKKVSACIACCCCEAECTFGAISVKNGKIKVDGTKCTKCHMCYNIDNSCWRYFSMRMPEKSQSRMVKIHSYKTFGLQETYVSTFVEMRERFFPWVDKHPLGKNMVPAAHNWFMEGLLTNNDGRTPSALLDIFERFGSSYSLGWDFVWIALANNSILVKWFISSTDIGIVYTPEQLAQILNNSYPELTESVVRGGLQSLKNMVKNSPLGSDNGVAHCEFKGKILQSITRRAKDVHQLTILYGLYLIAAKAERGSFTVRELLTADVESVFVSPLVAFGITPDTFKKQCEGLRTKYPGYISTTFTHGNDGLEVFPQKHTIEDVIMFALEDIEK